MSTALEVVRPEPTPMSLLQQAVEQRASIDTIERLAKLQREMQEFQARIAYGEAMTKAQESIPRIAPDLANPQTRSKYASYAALDRVIRPVYTRQGFSLSFNTADSTQPDHLKVLCTVRHIAGHSELFQLDMPNDGKGAKGGDVMTKTHAQAAGASYGMRYLLKMIFNIAIGEDDTDGNHPSMPESALLTWLDAIEATTSLVDLQRVYVEGYKVAEKTGDKNATGQIIRAKDKRKKELREQGGEF